jgi:Ca2+-binding RTX toxin-like protein
MSWAHAANVSTALDLAGRMSTFLSTGEFQFQDATNGQVLAEMRMLFSQISQEITELGIEITERDRAQELVLAMSDINSAISTLEAFGDYSGTSLLPSPEQQATALNKAETALDTLFELAELWIADNPSPNLMLSLISAVTTATMVRVQTVEAFDNGAFGRDTVSDDILRTVEFLNTSDQAMRDALTFPMRVGGLSGELSFRYPENPDHVPPALYRAALQNVIEVLAPDSPATAAFRDFFNVSFFDRRFYDLSDPLNFDVTSATLLPQGAFDPQLVQDFVDTRPWDYDNWGALPDGLGAILNLSQERRAAFAAEWAWLSQYVDMAVSHVLMRHYDVYSTTIEARSTAYSAFAPLTWGQQFPATDGNDDINGTIYRDFMNGLGGDDVFRVHASANLVLGGAGDDTIYGGSGSDRLYGGADDDSIEGSGGLNRIFGEDGEDTLVGGWQDDTIDGGAGHDYINGSYGNDSLIGGTGNDTIYGQETSIESSGDDTIHGGIGNDVLYGGRGNDEIYGGPGNDYIVVEPTDDGRNEVAIYGHRSGGLGDGGEGNDTLLGGVGKDTLKGGYGNDSLSGGAGNDLLEGGADDDTLDGGIGDDSLDGGDGTGDLAVFGGYRSDYTITDIGSGSYTLEYTGALTPYFSGTDTLTGIEQVQFRYGTYALSDLVNDAPVAVNDATNSAVPVFSGDNFGGSGNVLSNDTDPDLPFGDYLRVSGVRRGAETDGGLYNLFGGILTPIRQFTHADGEVDYGIRLSTSLGVLYIATDGAYTYYTSAFADVTGTVTDVFSYEITDLAGVTDTAEIVVNVSHTNAPGAGSVEITGTPSEGETLTAVSSLTDYDGLGPLSYQWRYYEFDPVTQTFQSTDIAGATSATYTLGATDVGRRIEVLVSYTDDKGTYESFLRAIGEITNVNDAVTGDVTITGTPTEDATLTAVPDLADGDGLGTFAYQWLRDGEEITDATSETYTLGQVDVGAAMSVRVSYIDQHGASERVTSAVTTTVTNVNDAPTGDVTITGTPAEGEVLTAMSSLEDEDGLGDLSYQWLRSGQVIPDATEVTLTLGQGDVGSAISVRISYTDQFGASEAVTSAATAAISNTNDLPTGTITVTDVSPADNVLSAVVNLEDDDGLGTFSYQWFRGAETIFGATFASYTMREGELSADISVAVTYVDGFGTTERVFSSSDRAVIGTAGNDRLEGGLGFDTISGGDGDDVYVFGSDFGTDLIQDSGGFDIIQLAEGITRADVRLWNNNYSSSDVSFFQESVERFYERNGFINIGDDRIYVQNATGISEGFQGIEEIHFADGTVLDLSGPQHYQGSDAYDAFIPHNELNNTIEGGMGGDQLEGGEGDNTYILNPGFGNSFIFDFGGNDVVAIGAGFAPSDLRITSAFYGLNLYIGDDYVNMFDPGSRILNDAQYGVETARFSDGTEIDLAGDLVMRGTDGDDTFSARQDDTLYGEAGNDVLGGGDGAAHLFGGAGDDTLTGGAGNDRLTGGSGADVAVFNDDSANITVLSVTGGLQVTSADGTDFVDASVETLQFNDTSLTFAQTAALSPSINLSPTGTVTITGTPAVDAVLTAVSTLDDGNGLGSLGYQWMRGGEDIAGATSTTYTLGQADIGAEMSVRVSYTDQGGAPEGVTSNTTATVSAVNHAPTGAVTITGTPAEDEVLTAVSTLADADGLGTLFYQWMRDGEVIRFGPAETYTLGQTDVGAVISVRVSYTDQRGTVETATSAATAAVSNVNDAVNDAVEIVGTATEDETLMAISGLVDEDGLGPLAYQWLRGTEVITGATSETYTLGQADVGAVISVRISYTDQQGTAEAATSTATAAVTNVNDVPTGSVTIAGTAAEGETLMAISGLVDEDGLGTLAYQWLRGTEDIAGATSETYTLGQADVGAAISVRVSYTDQQGTPEAATSAATAVVTNVNDAPSGTVIITGTAAEDAILTAVSTLADEDGLGPLSYHWMRGTEDIAGATSATYTLGQADVGAAISVRVSYTDQQGTPEAATSAATAAVTNVNDAPSGSVTITGTAAEDAILTAVSTLADEDGLGPLAYQWLRGTEDIAGATSETYTLGQADVGAAISVRVSYTDQQGTPEAATSAATAVVTNVNDAPTGTVTITGTAAEDAILTAVSTLADEDGLGPLSYHWLRGTEDIAGATSETYTLGQADVGAAISVRVSYTDQQGTPEAATSAATAAVTNVNDAPSGSVTITGTAAGDGILTAVSTLADEDGLGPLAYQWMRGIDYERLGESERIVGATSETYTLGQADIVGAVISLRVSYTDDFGMTESASSTSVSVSSNLIGTAGNNRLEGGIDPESFSGLAGSDTLIGNGGNDTLDGGVGPDHMTGGAGDDIYYVDDAGDVVSELANGGTDTIMLQSAVVNGSSTNRFVMAENVENIVIDESLIGYANYGISGNALDNTFDGNNVANVALWGSGDGNDTYINVVSAIGGDGNDTMYGGTSSYLMRGGRGNDSIIGGETAELLSGEEGHDIVYGNGGDDDMGGSLRERGGNDQYFGGDGNDWIETGTGDDTLDGGVGNDSLGGGDGLDVARIHDASSNIIVRLVASLPSPPANWGSATDGLRVTSADGVDFVASDVETFQFNDTTLTYAQVAALVVSDLTLTGTTGDNQLAGGAGNDTLNGGEGSDTLNGGDGEDVIIGGDGNDSISAGATSADLRDVVFAGAGNDSIDGGYGNDELRGDAGNDSISGGFGADIVIGGSGNDTLTGGSFGDEIHGGDGIDFVNGGFGYDRVTGGAGADTFYHLGIFDHGSDWIQDYDSAEGDVLMFGNASASASDFQINFAHTATPEGERSGDDDVQEAFVIYRPTGQIMWALVDGEGQSSINLQIAGSSDVFDLLEGANTAPVAADDALFNPTPSDEVALNSITTGLQSGANVTALSTGGYVATWWSNDGADSDGFGIKARIFDAAGHQTTAEFLVNTDRVGNQFSPEATELDNGNIVIAWRGVDDATQSGAGTAGTRARILNPDGSQAVAEFTVNEFTQGNQYSATPVALAGGGFVVTWQSNDVSGDGNGASIRGRIFTSDGTPSPEFLVNQGTFGDQLTPDVAALSDGRFAVSWYGTAGLDPATPRAAGDGIDHDGPGISARIFNANGTPSTDEFQVNANFDGGQRSTEITELDDTNILVSWDTDDPTQDGSGRAVMGRIFQSDGTAQTGEFIVNQNVGGNQASADAVSLGNGTFVVTWDSEDHTLVGGQQDPSEAGIRARLFNNDGTPAGDEFLVNQNTDNSQSASSVTALAGSGFTVSWQTNDTAVDIGNGVRARTYDNEGNPVRQGSFDANTQTIITAADILGNDTDADGDTLVIASVADTSDNGGTVALNGDGSVTYTPAENFNGSDNFEYMVTDGNTGSDLGTVSFNVGVPTANVIRLPTEVISKYAQEIEPQTDLSLVVSLDF